MQFNLKKISLLGLVLMGASAITAAVLPSKDKNNTDDKRVMNGDLTITSGAITPNQNVWSCKTRDVIMGNLEVANCHDTDSAGDLSSTTREEQVTSGDAGVGGSGNPNTTGNDVN